MRTDRNDKEDESESDGFDETHIVGRFVQAIVLDLCLDRERGENLLFVSDSVLV